MARSWSTGVAMALGVVAAAAAGAEEPSFSLQLRPRVEVVDEEGSRHATGLTARTVLGMHWRGVLGWPRLRLRLEATNVAAAVDRYHAASSEGPWQPGRGVIADPTFTRLTQALVAFDLGAAEVIAGRQMLVHDDHRFLGNVGWRQMPQTFEGITVRTARQPVTAEVSYLSRRLGVRPELDQRYREGSLVGHASFRMTPVVTAYTMAYLVQDAHDTFGLGLKAATSTWGGRLEVAVQRTPSLQETYAGGPRRADFLRGELRRSWGAVTLRGNLTGFGAARGNARTGFATPLATLHAFDGWSDALAGKAAQGDPRGWWAGAVAAGFSTARLGKVECVFHAFRSRRGHLDYGRELDASYERSLGAPHLLTLKAARYWAGDAFGRDTTKLWLMYTFTYPAP